MYILINERPVRTYVPTRTNKTMNLLLQEQIDVTWVRWFYLSEWTSLAVGWKRNIHWGLWVLSELRIVIRTSLVSLFAVVYARKRSLCLHFVMFAPPHFNKILLKYFTGWATSNMLGFVNSCFFFWSCNWYL